MAVQNGEIYVGTSLICAAIKFFVLRSPLNSTQQKKQKQILNLKFVVFVWVIKYGDGLSEWV